MRDGIYVPFKILLLLVNAHGHHPHNFLILMRTLIRCSCLDEGLIGTFRSYYYRKTFIQLVMDTTKGQDQLSVKDFWRNFNVKKAVDSIGSAWAEVLQSCMIGV
jgi:hypothetical protein